MRKSAVQWFLSLRCCCWFIVVVVDVVAVVVVVVVVGAEAAGNFSSPGLTLCADSL